MVHTYCNHVSSFLEARTQFWPLQVPHRRTTSRITPHRAADHAQVASAFEERLDRLLAFKPQIRWSATHGAAEKLWPGFDQAELVKTKVLGLVEARCRYFVRLMSYDSGVWLASEWRVEGMFAGLQDNLKGQRSGLGGGRVGVTACRRGKGLRRKNRKRRNMRSGAF